MKNNKTVIDRILFIGIVATCVGYPTDTVRVVQQVTNVGAVQSMHYIYNEQGVIDEI